MLGIARSFWPKSPPLLDRLVLFVKFDGNPYMMDFYSLRAELPSARLAPWPVLRPGLRARDARTIGEHP
jgi:hypothetical protein